MQFAEDGMKFTSSWPASDLEMMEQSIDDYLSSENMHALLKWARENFDFVVLDLPPMTAASDAEGMTTLADACLLVVRQNMSEASAINRFSAALENNRAKLLGCVLNNVISTGLTSGMGGRYGRYGHYGHYGNYGSYGSRK